MDSYEGYKDRLRQLLANMERNPSDIGMPMLDAFVNEYEESLYNEIGRLARQLHDSLISFRIDEKIIGLTQENIPNAKERLRYVVTVTEQATQKVLSIVEKSIPLSQAMSTGADQLHETCGKAVGHGWSSESFSLFMKEMRRYLGEVKGNAGLFHDHLTEILMTQEYQDLTGQIIKRVIGLIQDVEDSLVNLVRITGQKKIPSGKKMNDITAEGPQISGIDNGDARMSGQDDVDQLLASMGF